LLFNSKIFSVKQFISFRLNIIVRCFVHFILDKPFSSGSRSNPTPKSFSFYNLSFILVRFIFPLKGPLLKSTVLFAPISNLVPKLRQRKSRDSVKSELESIFHLFHFSINIPTNCGFQFRNAVLYQELLD